MSEGKLFKCPSCGSSLSPAGAAPQIKCAYCGSQIIVPAELRDKPPVFVQLSEPESEPTTPSHRSGFGIGLALFLFIVIGGVIALAFFVFRSTNSDVARTTVAKLATPTPAGFANIVLTFGAEGTAPGLFQDPRHIAIDPSGTMYIADYRTLRVQQFDPSGKYISGWTIDGGLCSNKSATPNNIAADRAGKVYVSYCGSIIKYDSATGKQLDVFKGDKNEIRDFYMGVAAIPSGGLLVWADGSPNASEVILRLDADGKVLARMPDLITNQSGTRAAAMTIKPVADGVGNLFILNGTDYSVYKFTREGKFVNKFGGVGSGVGQFETWARDVALDNQSRVYVVDGAGIKMFDPNGVYLDKISSRTMGGIREFAIDDRNGIYVIGGDSTVFKLQSNGY